MQAVQLAASERRNQGTPASKHCLFVFLVHHTILECYAAAFSELRDHGPDCLAFDGQVGARGSHTATTVNCRECLKKNASKRSQLTDEVTWLADCGRLVSLSPSAEVLTLASQERPTQPQLHNTEACNLTGPQVVVSISRHEAELGTCH